MLAAPVSAPLIEEIAKALGVLAVFWLLRAEFDNMRDGIVYGALIGLGFNWYEAALYVVQTYAEHGRAAFGLQLGATLLHSNIRMSANSIWWQNPDAMFILSLDTCDTKSLGISEVGTFQLSIQSCPQSLSALSVTMG